MHAALVSVLLGLSVAAAESPEAAPAPPVVEAKPARALEPPAPSLFGARLIEPGRVLYGLQGWYSLSAAFVPGLRTIAALGLGGGFDVQLAFDFTLPPLPDRETMEALELTVRRSAWQLGPVDTAFSLELSAARFGSKESAENLAGPRHTIGMRDLNAGVGMPLSFGILSLSVKPFVIASIDLQPASSGPLTGAPPAWTLGWVFGLDVGNELRFSRVLGGLRLRPGFQFLLHTRRDDRTVTLLTTLAFSAG